jgi:exo-beta-1,3-glucanase (GH17 family)
MYMKKLALLASVFLACFMFVSCSEESKTSKVTVEGRKILVNNIPYFIKGICYNPVPKGSDKRSFESLTEDLALMNEAGINTIRVYSPIDDAEVLDEINAAGIKMVIGFGYNQNGYFDVLSGSFIDYIEKYKSHDAILLWELGNEYNFHPEWFDGDMQNWYDAMNNAAELIHEADPSHLVTTAHGELPDALALSSCPNVDVWGMNVYRWDNPEEIFAQWSEISSKPMYLSEAGADSYMVVDSNGYGQGENERMQADATRNILDDIFSNTEICSGVAIFAFSDELWKAGNNNTLDAGGSAPFSGGVPYDGAANEEYWGILDVDRNKKEAYEVVKEKFMASVK